MVSNLNPENLIGYIRKLEDLASDVGQLLMTLAHNSNIHSPELMQLAIRSSKIIGNSDDMQEEIKKFLNINSLLLIQAMELEDKNKKLEKTLFEVEALKRQQDADYFLSAQLLKPFSNNNFTSNALRIVSLTKQKKRFRHGKYEGSIGGDISSAYLIKLAGREFTVFANADAMGKSIQGANGAMIFGAVLQAIVQRTGISSYMANLSPEIWLRDAFVELQKVFQSFEGGMLVTLIIGLIDNFNGCIYFLNAEHPAPVILREGKAGFIKSSGMLYRIGLTPQFWREDESETLKVSHVRLKPGDIMIFGSDGKDELAIGHDASGQRIIQSDDSAFIAAVEAEKGNLEQIYLHLCSKGEIIDDLSLVRIEFFGASPREINPNHELLKHMRSNLRRANLDVILSLLSENEKKIADDPCFESVRAKVSYWQNDWESALSHAQKALQENGLLFEMMRFSIRCLIRLKRFTGATELANRLRLIDFDNPTTQKILILVDFINGNKTGAWKTLEKLRRDNNGNSSSIDKLHRLLAASSGERLSSLQSMTTRGVRS